MGGDLVLSRLSLLTQTMLMEVYIVGIRSSLGQHTLCENYRNSRVRKCSAHRGSLTILRRFTHTACHLTRLHLICRLWHPDPPLLMSWLIMRYIGLVMIAQWKSECISLSVLSVSRVQFLRSWQNILREFPWLLMFYEPTLSSDLCHCSEPSLQKGLNGTERPMSNHGQT